MIKTAVSEERLRKLIRTIVQEELSGTIKEKENHIQISDTPNNDQSISISNKGPWAVFGPPKPDPAKNFKRLERPRALPGWSEPYQEGHDLQPGPFRPKR